MFKNYYTIVCLFLMLSFSGFSQENPSGKKVKVSGKVVEKVSGTPLGYTTITLKDVNNPSIVTGGVTDDNGNFNFSVNAGVYNVTIEFISFQIVEMKQKSIMENTNFGTIKLSESTEMLNEVKIIKETPLVEMKLDKKVYNVSKDMTVKGGTASDVLDNVPSVQVDTDGTVSLRGNSDVRILVDGRPITATDIGEALRQIPADALDKIEVVTNPSARYDAEGGGGVLNIILKKGKNQGVNGSITANGGLSGNKNNKLIPSNQSLTANLNYKTKTVNWFTTVGVFDRTNPGNSIINSKYLNPDGTTNNYIDQRNYNEKQRTGNNIIFGADWDLNKSMTWTNSVNYRTDHGGNPEEVTFANYDANRNYLYTTSRFNDQQNNDKTIDYNSGLVTKFKREGHKLTVNGTYSKNAETDSSVITNYPVGAPYTQKTLNNQGFNRGLAQADYVLPLGKDGQFEAGYKGDFNTITSDYKIGTVDSNGNLVLDPNLTNNLHYIERTNALYSQIGSKVNKFSYLFGMRWEGSNIDINQLVTQDYHKKKYNNFYPTAFISYASDEQTTFSISFSRRISRPRGRMINPFSSYSSNINYFKGNPELNPAYTSSLELGMMKNWSKFSLNSSLYTKRTTGAFQYVRLQDGTVDGTPEGTPIIVVTPINLSTQYSSGLDLTFNYTPFKWWRLNSNWNVYRNQTDGEYSYTDSQGKPVVQNYDNVAFSWFTRLTSKVTLPYKIDWQTIMNYQAPQNNAQGKSIGIFYANLAFAKDVLKDKGTIAFNVQDLFNSHKRIFQNNLPQVESYTAMQYRVRQFNLSFTYRFNKRKTDKERPVKNTDQQPDDMGY